MKEILRVSLVLIAVIIAVVSVPSAAFAIYGVNTPAQFCTSQGSWYVVTNDALVRYKFDGTNHIRPGKNIFYSPTRQLASDIKTMLRNGHQISVENLSQTPIVGYTPIDVYLTPEGTLVSSGIKYHIGHPVSAIGTDTNRRYCLSQSETVQKGYEADDEGED